MATDPKKANLREGLKINGNKSKVIFNWNVPEKNVKIKDEELESVQEFHPRTTQMEWNDE